MSEPTHFADAFNFALGVKGFVRPENLRELDRREFAKLLVDDKSLMVQKFRDVLKECILKHDEHYTYLLLGIENQTDVHYAMPVKNMVYDALNYDRQVTEHRRRHEALKDFRNSGEFLSGMSKADTLKPVITLTIYFGAGEWDAPRALHEMFGPIDTAILPYVNDYKLNLIIPREIKDFSTFTTELRNLFMVLASGTDKNMMQKILDDESYQHLSPETASLIKACTGIDMEINEDKEVVNMMPAFEEWAADERAAGMLDTLVALVRDKLLDLEVAAKRANMPVSEFQKLL